MDNLRDVKGDSSFGDAASLYSQDISCEDYKQNRGKIPRKNTNVPRGLRFLMLYVILFIILIIFLNVTGKKRSDLITLHPSELDVSLSHFQHEAFDNINVSNELYRYAKVREQVVRNVKDSKLLGESDIEKMVDIVMTTIGISLDNPSLKPGSEEKSLIPSSNSNACPDRFGLSNRNSYQFKKWKGREYVNETFVIKEDVAVDRRIPKCLTVFERTKREFNKRFTDTNSAISSISESSKSAPNYPQPAGGKGGLLYLFHVHKTGGSTIRDLFHTYSDWTHSPYNPQKASIDYWLDKFASYQSETEVPKLLIEAHSGYSATPYGEKDYIKKLDKLKTIYGDRGMDCPISVLFFRDPLSFYISVFRWAIVANQSDKATWLPQVNGTYFWGKNFLEWAPDNAMSRVMHAPHTMFFNRPFLQLKFLDRSNGIVYDRGGHPSILSKAHFNETHYEELRGILSAYDIVAPLSHFDHVMAMLTLIYGWDELPYYTAIKPQAPTECPRCTSKETNEDICPDMNACRAKVEELAPYDYKIYNEFNQKFLKQIEYLGDGFNSYVQEYKKEFKSRIIKQTPKSKAKDGSWLRNSREVTKGSAGMAFFCKNIGPSPGKDCLAAAEQKRDGKEIQTEILTNFKMRIP